MFVDAVAMIIGGWVLIAVFFMLRNVWLFNRLLKLSDDEVLSIQLTYHQMMLRVWVWDVRKFIP